MTVEVNQHLFPVLRYADARAAIAWLERVLGCITQDIHDGPDGSVAHAELRLGPSVIGVTSTQPPVPDNPWSTVRQGVYVRVPDTDRHHARASAAGADIVMPVEDKPYGSREYSVRDIGAHLWAFGTYAMGAVPAAGAPNLIVGLSYADVPAAIRFLRDAFGFEPTLELPGPDGRIQHAELTYGGGSVLVRFERAGDALWGNRRFALYVREDDPDRHFNRVRHDGVDIAREPADTAYGAREYYLRDLEGFLWGISTHRPNTVPPA